MENQIIQSRLDTDFYKFTMYQTIFHQYKDVKVKVKLFCRNPEIHLGKYKDEINEQIKAASEIRFTKNEIDYLESTKYFKKDILQSLIDDKLNYDSISIDVDENDNLNILVDDYWYKAIWWELIILPIVQEVYQSHVYTFDKVLAVNKLFNTINKFKELGSKYKFTLSDFGVRRRFSREWQDFIIGIYTDQLKGTFVGTSNVKLAMKYHTLPIGTFAHEMYQGIWGTCNDVTEVITKTLDSWVKEYRGDLGIALTDIFGLNVFLKYFDMYYCKLFSGVRHDSGDPILWGNMMIQHYLNNKTDPSTKSFVFSDSIDPMSLSLENILNTFNTKVRLGLGIGTSITNNVGAKPLNLVMKVIESNGIRTCKVPDGHGKALGDQDIIDKTIQKLQISPITMVDLMKLQGNN